MTEPTLVLVGGFLGAGKTSLLLKASEVLMQRGLSVGIITNDQSTELIYGLISSWPFFNTNTQS